MKTKDIINETHDIIRYAQNGLDYLTSDMERLTPFEQAKNLRELKALLKHLAFEIHGLGDDIDSLAPIKLSQEDSNGHI